MHGFSNQLVQDIISNAHNIFTLDNVLSKLPVFSTKHAKFILGIFQDVFQDIEGDYAAADILLHWTAWDYMSMQMKWLLTVSIWKLIMTAQTVIVMTLTCCRRNKKLPVQPVTSTIFEGQLSDKSFNF